MEVLRKTESKAIQFSGWFRLGNPLTQLMEPAQIAHDDAGRSLGLLAAALCAPAWCGAA